MARPKVYTSETQPYSLTIRIPRDLFDQMERYTGRHGRSRTDALVEGLKLWLERKASSKQLSHDNNNTVMHELTTPAHFLDDGIPFDDEHRPVPAPATAVVPRIPHDSNAVMQEGKPQRRGRKGQSAVQRDQNPVLAEDTSASSADVPAYDTAKHHLDSLCKRGHEWGSTGQSLRNDDNQCLECKAQAKREKRQAKRQATAAD